MERSIEVIEKNPKLDDKIKTKLINDLKKAFEIKPAELIVGQVSYIELEAEIRGR